MRIEVSQHVLFLFFSSHSSLSTNAQAPLSKIVNKVWRKKKTCTVAREWSCLCIQQGITLRSCRKKLSQKTQILCGAAFKNLTKYQETKTFLWHFCIKTYKNIFFLFTFTKWRPGHPTPLYQSPAMVRCWQPCETAGQGLSITRTIISVSFADLTTSTCLVYDKNRGELRRESSPVASFGSESAGELRRWQTR